MIDQIYTQEILKTMGKELDERFTREFGQRVGFALLLFEFHNVGIGNYVSNAQRGDMIKLLRETADRLENNEDIDASLSKTMQ